MKRSHGIIGNLSAVRPHVGGVLVVQPFHLEMQVHVIETLAQTMFLVLCTATATANKAVTTSWSSS